MTSTRAKPAEAAGDPTISEILRSVAVVEIKKQRRLRRSTRSRTPEAKHPWRGRRGPET